MREALLRKQTVDWVYCPDTWPVTQGSVEELRALPFLEEVAAGGQGALFRVQFSEFRE